MTLQTIETPSGIAVSYDTYGSGPPLVLVHGAFSDHQTNWQECRSMLAERFTVHAVARRGRGATSATQGHSVRDEVEDVVAVLRSLGGPAALLGHSYGAVCALNAAVEHPQGVSKLILYEHPAGPIVDAERLPGLEAYAGREDWDGLVEAFMGMLQVPADEIAQIRTTPFWSVWTADARATMHDLRALVHHRLEVERYRRLPMPVLLMIGSESPRELYATDALAAVLPDARIVALEGTAHEGMTMVPELFVRRVSEFLLGDPMRRTASVA